MKGPSSGGKSYTTERTLDFFPPETFYALSAMSERALAYSDEPLERILVIFEAAGWRATSRPTDPFVALGGADSVRDGREDPRWLAGTVDRARAGPTGLLVTTTATQLHPENETRLLSIPVTDTPEQTRQVFRAIAAGGGATVDLAPWQALQSWLAGGAPRRHSLRRHAGGTGAAGGGATQARLRAGAQSHPRPCPAAPGDAPAG